MRRARDIGSSLPPRLRRYVLAVTSAGVLVVAAAAVAASRTHLSSTAALGIAMFLVFTLLAEWRPVPIDPAGRKLVSFAFIFVIATRLIFGWEWSILTGAGAIGLAMAAGHSDRIKVAFNAATYALAAGLSSLVLVAEAPLRLHGYGGTILAVVLTGACFVLANVYMVCVAIGLSSDVPVVRLFRDHLRYSGAIFGIMVFVTAQAVIFWRLSPPLVLLLGAPLFALTLYQRSSVRGRAAEEAASTDKLTGLRNRRAFDEDSANLLAARAQDGGEFTLCLLDIDRFKQVNDRHGHLAGDAVMLALARALERCLPMRAYRLGGDEFGLLLEGAAAEVEATMGGLQTVFAEMQDGLPLAEPVTISAGVAVYPTHADDLHSLKKRADMALYQSKYNGRNRATVYDTPRPESEDADFFSMPFPLADIRVVTARRLASLVDAFADASAEAKGLLQPLGYSGVLDRWRNFDGNHSQAVAGMVVELARRLGVEAEEVEHLRLAALLHDIGKIAVPEHILNKPGPLTPAEQTLVERHPLIGFELLRDLGLSPVDTYVLHHHERWDGAGYPDGLKGGEIPFGSRLILVADAFDVLTSTRSYHAGVSVEAAMHELQTESGRQFDPLIVSALHDLLAHRAADGSSDPAILLQRELAWSSSTSQS